MNQTINYEIQRMAYFTEKKLDFLFCMLCYITGLIIGMLNINDDRYHYTISNIRDLILELYERTNDRPNDRTNDNDEPVDLSQ
jgi:hypothetical protein